MHIIETNSEVQVKLSASVIEALADQFQGQMILPKDESYEQARRVWNGVIDRHPALIVRPLHAADVALAVKFARSNDLLLSVRGGGHNVAGHGTNDNGLVIDLSLMKKIVVDPVSAT